MEVWWRESLKRVSTIAAPDVTAMEWSPDGRYLVGATLSPRLRVDNGVRLWHYRGVALAHRPFAELFQVAWRPVDLPARPLSPVPAARPGVGPAPKAPAAPVKAAYVPPHLRNQNGAVGALARVRWGAGRLGDRRLTLLWTRPCWELNLPGHRRGGAAAQAVRPGRREG